jgi:hypothetical protein
MVWIKGICKDSSIVCACTHSHSLIIFIVTTGIVYVKLWNRFGVEVMLEISVPEAPSLNVGQDTSYPNWGSSWFSLGPWGKHQGSTLIRPWLLPAISFAIRESSHDTDGVIKWCTKNTFPTYAELLHQERSWMGELQAFRAIWKLAFVGLQSLSLCYWYWK